MSVSARVPEGQFSKVELDVERHLLQTTVQLSDGTEGLVFSRGCKNDANLFVYNCHLCKAANLIGERSLQIHIYGRKHQRRLTERIDAEAFRAPIAAARGANMSIAPGEPVPPGFEDEVRRVATLQPVLDHYKAGPLIGLEYIIELCSLLDGQTRYICLLCDKKGDHNTIISHATSYNHRLQYLDKFFPTLVKELAQYRYKYEARNLMPPLVESICEAIEQHHGRLTLSVHDADDFPKNRNLILQQIEREKHFSEKNGPNFTDVVDHRKITNQLNTGNVAGALKITPNIQATASAGARAAKRDKKGSELANRENFDEISSSESDSPLKSSPWFRSKISRRDRSRSSDRYGKKLKRSISRSLSPQRRNVGGRVHRSPPFDKYDVKKRGSTNTKKTAEQNQEKLKKEKFKTMLDNAVKELEKELKEHEKNPEKHPLYPEEWKTFWNRRYKELQAEKKDPNKYDYKPEWIIFWTKRMKELHLEAIELKKAEIRKLCGLPESPMGKLEVIDISDEELSVSPVRSEKRSEKRSSGRYSRERERERERDRDRDRSYGRHASDAPDYYHSNSREYHSSHSRYGVRYMDPDKLPKYEPEQKEEEVDDGPLTVVAVLRLITAVEEQLGSLGPKVIDLLAKALALEKIKANSSDEMLLNDDTSIFFETVKEKLKGQILAGVLESSKVKAVKKAVKNIAAILHQATTKEKAEVKTEQENPAKTKLLKTDILDRQIISSKLAAALVVQEKTDISKEDMDRLINVFILMVKLSKERNSNVEVKDLLLELGIETNVFDEDDMVSNISKVESKDSRDAGPLINNAASSLDSLTDSDLQTLLQNFKHLSSEEQHHLIAHLKKLESSDPIRVEKLRKFVDVGDLKRNKPSPRPEQQKDMNSRKSNFSDDEAEHKRAKIIESDDDDDDYNFDDVVKAASKNISGKSDVKSNEPSRPDSLIRDPEREASNLSMGSAASANTNMSLANTQNLIANLLGSLQQNSAKQPATGNSGGNVIPTIGAAGNRGPNFQANSQGSNADNFFSQSQSSNVNQMNPQYSNPNFPQQSANMFGNSFFAGNQGTKQQAFSGMHQPGPGGMNAFNNINMPNPPQTQVPQPQNFFNRFNPNVGQGQNMPPGNYMNSQNQQPQQNFFNRPVQNQGGFY